MSTATATRRPSATRTKAMSKTATKSTTPVERPAATRRRRAAAPAEPQFVAPETSEPTVKVTKSSPTSRKPVERAEDYYSTVADKEPTDLHKHFAEWITEQTGVEVDLTTVALVCRLRMDHQASPENQERLAREREAAKQAKGNSEVAKREKFLKQARALGFKVVAE